MLAKPRPGGRVSSLACLGIAAGPNQPFFSQIIYSGNSLPLSYARFIVTVHVATKAQTIEN